MSNPSMHPSPSSEDFQVEMRTSERLQRLSQTMAHISRNSIRSFHADSPTEWSPSFDQCIIRSPSDNVFYDNSVQMDFLNNNHRKSYLDEQPLTTVDELNWIPLKPSSVKEVTRLRRRFILQTVLSILRNLACFAFIAAIAVIAGIGHVEEFFSTLADEIALALLIVGCAGVLAQVLYGFTAIKRNNSSRIVLANILKGAISLEKFRELMRNRMESSPYIGAQLKISRFASLSGSCCCRSKSSMTSRKTNTVLTYDAWADRTPIFQDSWTGSNPRWIILGKDYRLVNARTSDSIKQELETFKEALSHDLKIAMKHISIDYTIDVAEGLTFPDAQALLVFPDSVDMSKRSLFYSFRTFLVSICFCVDSIYYILFHIKTRYSGNQFVIKYIDRN